MLRRPNEVEINGIALDIILKNHQHYLNRDCEGWASMQANLNRVDLSYVDLSECNLEGAFLQFANLRSSYLSKANLKNAVISGADLEDAYLMYANLSEADLNNADLSYVNLNYAILKNTNLFNAKLNCITAIKADFECADLECANLSRSNLYATNLSKANMSHAILCYANLANSYLVDAIFDDADLEGVNLNHFLSYDYDKKKIDINNNPYTTGKILTENIIGYKKCYNWNSTNHVIVKIEIPRGAVVFSINGKKYRTNKAKVLKIYGADRARSIYYVNKNDQTYPLSYYVGDEFTIYDFNLEYNKECAEGIHFFLTAEDAEHY